MAEDEPTKGRSRALTVIAVAALAVGATALVAVLRTADGSGSGASAVSLTPFPAPPPAHVRSVATEDFVGSDTCASCHAEQHEAWSSSTHGRAGGAADPSVIISPFNGSPIRFRDGVVVPRRRGGQYEFVVSQLGQEDVVLPVDGVIGGGHMLGGGTQGYVTRLADGTVRFLAFDWSETDSAWFCNTGSRLDEGWVPITPSLSLADCGDWPAVRTIGTLDRFANCQQCHGSQIETTLNASLAAYETRFTTLQINCESCHGPGREHVQLAEAGGSEFDENLGLTSLVGLSKNESLNVCFQCHALKDVLREDHLPGEPLDRYFALKFPMLGDDPYTADSRTRTFAYQATHLSSACYLDGPMDCVSCHEPHGQGYWDTNGQPLPSPYDDGQCLSCHPSKADDPQAHTFHPPDSDGARCVSCHMPYLQHPEVGSQVSFARSDHTIPVPRPAFDAASGFESACAGCHSDQSAEQLQARAEEWWGELRPHRPAVEGLLEAARQNAPAPTSLLHVGAGDPMAQFQGLARYFVEGLAPDDATVTPDVLRRLEALADDPDLDVRSLALASLHWTAGDRPDIRDLLVAALEADDGRIRARWRLALGFLGDFYRDGGSPSRARVAYEKAQQIAPEDAELLRAMALMFNQTGDFAAARSAFERSLSLEPEQPLTWVNLGVALNGLGDPAGATRAYQRALEYNAQESLAHFNLGNNALRAGDLPSAAAAYARAVEADPGLAMGHFNLARTLIQLGRIPEALPHARKAVEFRPDYDLARQMLSDLETAVGGG